MRFIQRSLTYDEAVAAVRELASNLEEAKAEEFPAQTNWPELKAPFGELVVTGRRQMAARADCGRTVARSHGHFDALLVGTEVAT